MNDVELLEAPITETGEEITDAADKAEFVDDANQSELVDQVS